MLASIRECQRCAIRFAAVIAAPYMESDATRLDRGYLIDAPEFGTLRSRADGAHDCRERPDRGVGDFDDIRRASARHDRCNGSTAARSQFFRDSSIATRISRNTPLWPAAKASFFRGCVNIFSRSNANSPDRKRARKRRGFSTNWHAMARHRDDLHRHLRRHLRCRIRSGARKRAARRSSAR